MLAKGIIAITAALLGCSIASAHVRHHTKLWNTAIIQGSFSDQSRIRYYLQPELNLVDDKYKYQTSFLYAGLGYQITPDLTLWLMDGVLYIKRINGKIRREDILRQQMNLTLIKQDQLNLAMLARLEERKDMSESRWSIRWREQLKLRVPFQVWQGHALVVFDELFFNLNHPKWTNNNSLLQQNRFFIGIGNTLTPHLSLDVGYLNQYLRNKNESMNNVLYLILNGSY